MVNLHVTESMNSISEWVTKNEGLLIEYAVNIIAALLILIIGFIVARVIANSIGRLMNARGVDETVSRFLVVMLRYALLAFTIVAALGRIGVQTNSVIAVMGAAGLAVGLALKNSLANFAAGVLLIAFRPFRTGELVEMGGVVGIVDNVHIFSTTLRTNDNKMVIIPNGKIISGDIINYSRQPERRIEILLGLNYTAEVEKVKTVLEQVINDDERIIKESGITIRLKEMNAPVQHFLVRVWVKNEDYWNVYFDLMENFKRVIDANNMTLPHPEMGIHLHQANPMDKLL